MLTSRARLPRRALWIALPVLALLALIVFLPAFLSIRGAHAYRPATATSLPGTWAKVADAPEAFGPLLPLPSGKVMQAVVDNYPTTAHLYSPPTNTWSDTSPLGYDIYGPTATLLKNGTVLLAGGDVFCGGYLCETAGAVIYNPVTDKWSATTPMNTPRAGHSATLLPDGRVLVAGGYNAGSILSSAEIYDPNTQQWTSAGNMHGHRYYHDAIELADDRVFVVGGYTLQSNTTSGGGPNCPVGGCRVPVFVRDTEIYDIAHNTWSTDVPLPDTRVGFTVNLLPSGLVLLAGGDDSDGTFPSASELYNTLTHAYSTTGNMVAPRASHTATLLATGQVLVASGFKGRNLLMSAEVYDPSTNTWLSTGNLPGYDWHAYGSATLLASGQALVVGGEPVGTGSDPKGPTRLTGRVPPRSVGPTHAADVFTTVPAAPGNVQAAAGVASATVSWSAPATGGSPITGYTITVAPGGKSVQVSGSATSAAVKGLAPDTAYTFTATATNALGSSSPSAPTAPVTPWSVSGAWTKETDTPSYFGTLLTLPSGKVLQAPVDASHAFLYDPVANSWSDTSEFSFGLGLPSATLLRNGTVLFVGGSGRCAPGSAYYTACAQIYDPAADQWSKTGSLITERGFHSATLLQDGRVLVVGGVNGPGEPGTTTAKYLSSAEIYDPSTGQWTSAGNLAEPRYEQSAILLQDGRVLIVGGYTANADCGLQCADPRTEIYDPKTNKWASAAPLQEGRVGSTATLLPNGKVLVAGGADGNILPPTGEVYDPAKNAWSPTGNMILPRTYHTATLLPTGRVLVVAGADRGSMLLSSEVYDPNTNAWQSTAGLPGKDAHALASATLLANGQVLVVGGFYVYACCSLPSGFPFTAGHQPQNNPGSYDIYFSDVYATVPGAPGNVQATAGIGSATISWSPAPSDGSSITSYTVTAAPGGGSVKVGGSATSVTVVGLTSGTSYTFTVTATNAFGSGPPSAPSNSVMPGVSPTPTSPSSAASGTPPLSGGTPSPTASEAETPTATPGATGTPTATPGPASNPPPNPQPPLLPICLGLLLLILIVPAVVIYLSRRRQNTQQTRSSPDSPRT